MDMEMIVMIDFLLGALTMWLLLSIFSLVAERLNFNYKDWYFYVCTAPILIPVLFFGVLGMCICRPWRNVVKPVEQSKFDEVVALGGFKHWRIGKNFYICFEAKARLVNKLYFVKTK